MIMYKFPNKKITKVIDYLYWPTVVIIIITYFFIYVSQQDKIINPAKEIILKKSFFGSKKILLKEFSLNSDPQNHNSLYLLTSTKTSDRFLLTTDDEIISNKKGDYHLELLHKNSFWNPSTCSRIPFVVKDGSVYFLESKINKDDKIKGYLSLYRLDVASKKLTYYDIEGIQTKGYIYKDNNDSIYIAEALDGKEFLKNINIYFFDLNKKTLTKEGSLDFQGLQVKNYSIGTKDDNLTLSFFDKNLKDHLMVYSDRKIQNKEIENQEINKVFSDGNYRIFSRDNKNYLIKQSFLDFDDLQIVYKNSKTIIHIKNDNTNKYVITDI